MRIGEYQLKKRFKTLKTGQLKRAAGSQAPCTFKYATLRTEERRDTVTLKKPNAVQHNIHKCTFKA